MKFIVDESTGMAVAQYLRAIGHDVVAVTETMPQVDDQTILIKTLMLHKQHGNRRKNQE